VNITFGVTASATYNAIFHITDKNIPHNTGCYRPIKSVIAPSGGCVNVNYPGPSGAGNTKSHPRMVDLILGALAQAVLDRVAAAEGRTGKGGMRIGGRRMSSTAPCAVRRSHVIFSWSMCVVLGESIAVTQHAFFGDGSGT
jgi:N-methylhydantoinase B/oxoprolinase/acetone carboxylase alpha subunit